MSEYQEPTFPDPKSPTFAQDLVTVLSNCFHVVGAILDRGLSLTDNVDCDVVSYTSNGTANTEDEVAHNLGKMPRHVILSSINKAGIVYKGTTAFTNTHIYMKTSVVSAAVQLIVL